jgi:phenylacetate-CoA ligase
VTSIAEERQEQRRWRLLPHCAGLNWFDQLVENEFLPPEEAAVLRATQLVDLLRFAAAQVPYYRENLRDLGRPEDLAAPGGLERIPVLSRSDVQSHFDRLQAQALPDGHHPALTTRTSGSTGQRVVVLHSNVSMLMINVVKQRESRWFRYDPAATLAVVRHASDLPRLADNAMIPDGQVATFPQWRYVGNFFETGTYLCFGDTNPLERQIEWLDRHRPAYLTALSSHLEHLALTWRPESPPGYLDNVLSIAQQLTPAMERCVKRALGVEVHANYGLNEVGIVATRCPEGGRYHVHAEHCLVEIVNDDGAAVRPGASGRLLVTALKNPVMPLIRYDTGDIAESVEGPCPCGRTLPAFAGIRGRYRRMAFLPSGTWGYWVATQEALERAPPEETASLRQYQLHQYRDGRFELRVIAVAPLPASFEERLTALWRKAAAGVTMPELRLVYVQQFARQPGGKFESFTSDFMPAPDEQERRAAGIDH